MKKQIIAGISITACVALCASVWPRSVQVGDLPAKPAKTAVTTETEARSEEMPQIIIPVVASAPEPESTAETESVKTE